MLRLKFVRNGHADHAEYVVHPRDVLLGHRTGRKTDGIRCEWKENLTSTDLESALRQGIPVILRAQHYTALNGMWENTRTVGDYMVVIGLDDRNVYLEDPYLLGSRLTMTRDDLSARWHSCATEIPIPPDAQKHYHEGVFIRGTPAAARPEFIGIQEKPSIVPPVPMP